MDKTGDGVVQLDDIKYYYNARRHPKVVSGEKTENEVLKEFLDTFDGNKDGLRVISFTRLHCKGTLTLDEFEKYYANVSASIDQDAYFSLMMFNAWKL